MKNLKVAKIIKQISENQFVIELTDVDDKSVVDRVKIAHDYVEFSGNSLMFTDTNTCPLLEGQTIGNAISILSEVQLSIYDFYQVILPYLNEHKYLQKEHALCLDSNGKYNYCNNGTWVFRYYDENTKQTMYKVRLNNESEYSTVTKDFYKQFIESNL